MLSITTGKPIWGLMALAGPLGLVAFKPDRISPEGILFLLVLSLPVIVGVALLIWFRDRPGRFLRFAAVAGLSLYWHGIGFGLWFYVLSGLN